MRRALLALLLLAGPALADDPRVTIGDLDDSAGMLPDDRIFLSNVSGASLNFWLALEGGDWQPFSVGSGDAALIRVRSLRLAIATAATPGDPAAGLPPPLSPGSIPADRHTEGIHFYARLEGGNRGQFCWSRSLDLWQVQRFGENYCD